MKERMTDEEEEPLSPMARTENGAKWIEAKINVQDHVAVPYIDPEEIGEDGQGFVDDYISRLTMIPLDRSRPLWDIHILNVKTSDAEAVGVIRSHHSLGDGMSLISLMLACTHKTLDPQNTAIPSLKRRETVLHGLRKQGWFLRLRCTVCSIATLLWNTLVDMLLLLATVLFLKDTKTPLTGGEDTGRNRKRFYHRVISLDDIKLIKNAMNMSINDVLVGVTQAALSRYLSRLYVNEQGKNNEEDDGALTSYPNRLPDRLRFRAACAVNLRSDIGFKALLVHYISYAGTMMISLAVDPTIIPNPHKICDDMEQSLKAMKAALWERGLL
ncbi:hypothetical protein YC2023_026807 [Brassica napus]